MVTKYMSAITNTGENTLSNSLKNILPNCDRVDALVGYFYFSGFQDLYQELEDKKIRILVGMDIDKKIIDKISTIKNLDENLSFTPVSVRSKVKEEYINNFSKFFNDTDNFDNESSIKAFEVFLRKIKDGSLEIKKSKEPQHGKFYILHNKSEFSTGGITPGLIIVGSSNLTYSGLSGQGEDNIILKEDYHYNERIKRFEELWNNSENITIVDINTADDFIEKVKSKIWLYQLPTPILMYYKVLCEYFSIQEIENMKTPGDITGGKFIDLKYQRDAINLGIDRIKKFGGVIIADVVGLGKSIIASAIAYNLGLKTIIIAPPHLKAQWEDYRSDFNFNGFVYTTGKIEEALERHGKDKNLLIILDEAHKNRNEDTDNYQLLHRLCSGNMVMALSATPFNNDPKDIYALIKLFTTPGQSTIKTVENLSTSFNELFRSYKNIRKELRKNIKNENKEENQIKEKTSEIANKLRAMIEPLVIRRSRLDLDLIEEYREDLKLQKIAFSKINPPELKEYELGDIHDLYINTLNNISPVDGSQSEFVGARYKPAFYLKPDSNFVNELISDDEFDESDTAKEKIQVLKVGQTNIAKFMRRLLVRRFESSIGSFNISLQNIISSSEKILDWYENRKQVPILKKGFLPEISDLENLEDSEAEEVLLELKETKNLLLIPADDLSESFKLDLENDIRVLKKIKEEWSKIDFDPKYNFLKKNIQDSLNKEPNRKILIFSEFSDTAHYLHDRFEKDKISERVFVYSSSLSSDDNKKVIKENFDAGIQESRQKNDYDVIVATDAISEGFNLHRAGTIINYDIPYNPTRVIQRIGRINRINKKVFDELFIYNFFPSLIGEKETATKAISTLKMNMINELLGGDTKTLTPDENLKTYFTEQYTSLLSQSESISWDAKHRNIWGAIRNNKEIQEQINSVHHRSRIARKVEGVEGVVTFAKKGDNSVFAYTKTGETEDLIIDPELALNLFSCNDTEEKSFETSNNYSKLYKATKEHLFRNNTKPKIEKGRQKDALDRIEYLMEKVPSEADFCKDLESLIKDLDALPFGLLKEIVQMKIDKNNPIENIKYLKNIIPLEYIESLLETAKRSEVDEQVVVLSEEFI